MEGFIVLGIAFAVFFIGELVYFFYHMYSKKKMQDIVFQSFENGKHAEFSKDELAFVKKEVRRIQGKFSIDEITWNDLDMDDVYGNMNYCLSSAGDQMLYGVLRNPNLDIDQVKKQKKIIEVLKKNQEHKKIASILFQIGGQCDTSIDALYHLPKNQIECNGMLAAMLLSFVVLVFLAGFFEPTIFMGVFFLLYLNFFYASYVRKSHADAFICSMHLVRYARAIKRLSKCACAEELNTYFPLFETSKALGDIQTSFFDDVVSGDGFFLLMAKNVFMIEILMYSRLSKQLMKHKKEILEAMKILGYIDMSMSVITYQQQVPMFCEADYCDDHTLCATQMIHPLVKNCVANDVELRENILISGSNASGKSTYLKMIAINAIYAQCFGFALAKSYCGDFFQIFTSMALKDSLEEKDSYFVAEVKSIKRILDNLNEEHPTLCMIDEILRGTNTGERIAASSEILMCFVEKPAICIAATHDIELTHILSKHYVNLHFAEDFDETIMKFDFQIQKGPSNSRNAMKLLKSLAFDEKILEEAKARRMYFEEHGTWVNESEVNFNGVQ